MDDPWLRNLVGGKKKGGSISSKVSLGSGAALSLSEHGWLVLLNLLNLLILSIGIYVPTYPSWGDSLSQVPVMGTHRALLRPKSSSPDFGFRCN